MHIDNEDRKFRRPLLPNSLLRNGNTIHEFKFPPMQTILTGLLIHEYNLLAKKRYFK